MGQPPQAASALTTEVLLTRVSAYLDHLAGEVQRAEQVVTAPMAKGAPPAGAIVQLQSLDRLRQSLEDLARLAQGLARPDSKGRSGWENPAGLCGILQLEATRALIEQQGVSPGPGRPSSGQVDFF